MTSQDSAFARGLSIKKAESYYSPCKQSDYWGSKFNWKKKSTYPRVWCQRICLSVCLSVCYQIGPQLSQDWQKRMGWNFFCNYLIFHLTRTKNIWKKFETLAVLLGLTDVNEDLPSSSWVCWGGVLDEGPTLGGLQDVIPMYQITRRNKALRTKLWNI